MKFPEDVLGPLRRDEQPGERTARPTSAWRAHPQQMNGAPSLTQEIDEQDAIMGLLSLKHRTKSRAANTSGTHPTASSHHRAGDLTISAVPTSTEPAPVLSKAVHIPQPRRPRVGPRVRARAETTSLVASAPPELMRQGLIWLDNGGRRERSQCFGPCQKSYKKRDAREGHWAQKPDCERAHVRAIQGTMYAADYMEMVQIRRKRHEKPAAMAMNQPIATIEMEARRARLEPVTIVAAATAQNQTETRPRVLV